MSASKLVPMLNNPAPTPAEIRKARKLAGYTVKEAASLVGVTGNYWRDCEQGLRGRTLHPGIAELFAIKSGLVIYKVEHKPLHTDTEL